MAECESISLNIPKYPWKYLNKLIWLCQGTEYAWSSYIFDKTLKMSRVVNNPMAWLYMQGLHRALNKSEYCSMCLSNTWICLNMHWFPSICLSIVDYCWMSLNMPENVWIKCSDYTRVLNMSHHLRYLTGLWICCRN